MAMTTKLRQSDLRSLLTENVWTWPLLAIITLSWVALYLMSAEGMNHEIHRPHDMQLTWSGFGATLLMWWGMAVAMMLPTIMPAIRTLRDICYAADQKGEDVGKLSFFVLGFLGVWFGFGVAAGGLQIAFHNVSILTPDGKSSQLIVSAVLFIIAGAYQFSTLKAACVSKCRAPMTFFMTYWEEGNKGFLRMGKRQGVYCLGCCWAMMLLMFAFGTMNLLWMFFLTLYMFAEKNWVKQKGFDKATGVVMMVVGLGMIIISSGIGA